MLPRLHGGAVGTELARRGFPLRAPAWSAEANLAAPDLVAAIHHDYAAAGAVLVTANTTCAHEHNVGAAMAEHCRVAIDLARRAGVAVAASLAMLPRSMSPDERSTAYRRAADTMRAADVLLLEGFVDPEELLRAVAATRSWPGSRWAALAGPGVAALPDAVAAAVGAGIAGLAVHCCTLQQADSALAAARSVAPQTPLAAYPSPECDDDEFARALVGMASAHRLTWVGSCCGSTPLTTAAIGASLSLAKKTTQRGGPTT